MNTQPKKLGLLPVTVIQMNAIIGSSVFAIPAILAQKAGSIGILTYIICIAIILCMTFSLSELTLIEGGKGWCYRFPKMWGGHILGMLASISYMLGVLVAMGFVTKQAGQWLNEFFPGVPVPVFSLIVVLALAGLVLAGKNISTLGQILISIVIVLVISSISAICLSHFNKSIFSREFTGDYFDLLALMPMLLFSFLGFESVASLYGIVKNPKRTIFLGGLLGVAIVGMLYILFAVAVVGAIAPEMFLENENYSLTSVIGRAFPNYRFLNLCIYLGGLFGIFGTLHSIMWGVSLLLVDVASRSTSPKITSLIEKDHLNGRSSLWIITLIILASAWFLMSMTILCLAVLLMSTAYVLSIVALFKVKDHRFLNRIICIIGIIGGALMVSFSLIELFR